MVEEATVNDRIEFKKKRVEREKMLEKWRKVVMTS
jgi:hypothetical protein